MQKIEGSPVRLLVWRVEESENGDEKRHAYIAASSSVDALARALKLWGAITQNDEKSFTVAFDREVQV